MSKCRNLAIFGIAAAMALGGMTLSHHQETKGMALKNQNTAEQAIKQIFLLTASEDPHVNAASVAALREISSADDYFQVAFNELTPEQKTASLLSFTRYSP